MIHSNGGFATVSYLRIKGVTLEKKPERGGDLIIPPLLEAEFARIQTLLRGHQSIDTHAVSEPVTRRPAAPPRSSSRSRRGDWVAVGNVHCQGTTFEEEVMQCFRELRGSSTPIERVALTCHAS